MKDAFGRGIEVACHNLLPGIDDEIVPVGYLSLRDSYGIS
jgi:hypothetical protein